MELANGAFVGVGTAEGRTSSSGVSGTALANAALVGIEVGVGATVGTRAKVDMDGVAAGRKAPTIIALCLSPACTDEYIKKNAPAPIADSIHNDLPTIFADASPTFGLYRSSDSSTCWGGDGPGLVELESGA